MIFYKKMLPQDPSKWFTVVRVLPPSPPSPNSQQQQQNDQQSNTLEDADGNVQVPVEDVQPIQDENVNREDYREVVANDQSTYDLSKQINYRNFNVLDAINIEDFTDFNGNESEREFAFNNHVRSTVRGLPQLYYGDRGSGMPDIIPSSRVLIETKYSIENYLQFIEQVLNSNNYGRLKNKFVKSRLQLMSSSLRNDILDQIDSALNIPVLDFSTANTFDALKNTILSEMWITFYQVKRDQFDYAMNQLMMRLFMIREYMSLPSTSSRFRRPGYFVPGSDQMNIGVGSTRRNFQTSNVSISSMDNYGNNLLLRLFMNYVIDNPVERSLTVLNTLGNNIDVDPNLPIDQVIQYLLTLNIPDENWKAFYEKIFEDMRLDEDVMFLSRVMDAFFNGTDISVFHIARFLERYLNPNNEDIMTSIFLGGVYVDGEFIKEITRSKYRRAVDMAKIKMIVEGSFVYEWVNHDDEIIPQYFTGYFKRRGLEYIQMLLDYILYRNDYPDLPTSPETSLSPLEEGSPLQILNDNQVSLRDDQDEQRERMDQTMTLIRNLNMRNMRNISTDNWLFGLSAEQVDAMIDYQNGNSSNNNPDNIIDYTVDPDIDLIRESMSEPIIIKTVNGAQLKRYIIDGFFTIIPSTMELVSRYTLQLRKLFNRIFRMIYGDDFMRRTNLYSDNDFNNRLDITTYDLIPYHSISLTLRRGNEDTLTEGVNTGVFDFTDNRFTTGEIRTKFQKKPLFELLKKLQEQMGVYENDYNFIVEIKIDILELYNKTLAFGKLRSAYDLGSRSYPKLKEKYVIVDTSTETNCLFACCFTAIEFENDYTILQNELKRQRGGVILKSAIYSYLDINNNSDWLNTIDENNEYNFNKAIYQAIANYYGRTIEVYNNVFTKFREIIPTINVDKSREPIRIMIHLMHACLMIPRKYFEIIYERQALPIKRLYESVVKNYLKRDFGIDICNNVLRGISADKDKLNRQLKHLYKQKLGDAFTRQDEERISEISTTIIEKYNDYDKLKKYFKSVLKEDLIKETIGHCRVLNDNPQLKDDPWTEVRNTSKGEIYLQGYQKQLTKDEFDFLCNNRVIEFKPLDTIGKFELLEKKEKDQKWLNKIGALDLETSLDSLSYQKCYGAGVAFFEFGLENSYPNVDFENDIICERFYNDDNSKALDKLFLYLFELRDYLNGYVFYAHNGGKFDYPIIMSQYLSENNEYWSIDSSSFVEMNGAIMSMTLIANSESIATNEKGEEYCYRPTITFRDSLRLITGSLENICRENKVFHQKLVYPKDDPRYVDHTMITLDNFRDLLWKIDPYLEHDCKGLLEVMMLFSFNIYKDMTINIVKCFTSATLAKKNFFQNYYDDVNYPIYNLPPTFDRILRSCYAGGRVESFVLGHVTSTTTIRDHTSPYFKQKRIFYHDVTSEYPDQGRRDLPYGKPELKDRDECTGLFRTELVAIDEEVTNEDGTTEIVSGYVENDILEEECFGFVEVDVYCDMYRATRTKIKPVHHLLLDKNHPLCEERKYLSNTLLFPWFKSTVRMWICSEEIKYCQKLNMPYIYRVLNVMTFSRAPYLKQLFEDCVKKKEEAGAVGNKCMRLTWKTTANSTYGFFALKVESRDSVIILDQKESMNWQRYLKDSRLRNVAQYPKYTICRIDKDISIKDVNVAIAAFITSYSRMKLHNIITKIESTGHKVYYCDTDSVISSCPLNCYPDIDNELRWDGTGEELGSLKNEAKEKLEAIVDKLFTEKEDKKKFIKQEMEREDNMEPGFNDAYFMGSKMYYLEMDKETPEGVNIFYTACAFKGFKKDDHVSHEKDVRAGKAEKSKPFLKDIFSDLNDGKVIEKEQTQFRGGKTSMMNEHTKGGVRVTNLMKKYKKYYIKGVQTFNERKQIIECIPHVI